MPDPHRDPAKPSAPAFPVLCIQRNWLYALRVPESLRQCRESDYRDGAYAGMSMVDSVGTEWRVRATGGATRRLPAEGWLELEIELEEIGKLPLDGLKARILTLIHALPDIRDAF